MTLYAIDDITDAFEATRAFLFPFALRRWLALALVVFFIGGASAGFQGGFNVDLPVNQPTGPVFEPNPGAGAGPISGPATGGANVEQFLPVLLALGVLAVVLALAFAVVGSIMEFVFVASLREEKITVRRFFGRYWGKGLRLLSFRVGLWLLTAVIVALPIIVASVVFFDPNTGVGGAIGAIVLLVPVLLLVVLVAALIYGFTTVFVVPIMLLEDRGVLSAWRRFWPTLRGQSTQYLAYIVLELLLSIAVGVVVAIVTTIALVVLAVPLGVVVGVVGLASGGFADLSLLSIAVLAVGALVFLLLVFVVTALVQVPVVTYFRYYALFVLGDTEETLDLIPERRGRVRGSGSGGSPPSSDDPSTA